MMKTGTTISHYQILEKLGEGGMGVVYKALDTKLNRTVALKFLPPLKSADSNSLERFQNEARATSMLDHPNISVIHEIGNTENGDSFICMGYYDGQTLKEKLENDPPDIDSSINIALQIASGLERAHEEGIIHRDIKPANIMITKRNEVKIVDFGLAKLLDESGVTETGRGIGTLAYMSPEQLQGKNVDSRTDLYSLGIILYEMLTGQHPYPEEHQAAMMYSIINTDPPPPSLLNPAVPKKFDDIVLKLIHKRPEKRFKTATELIKQLENVNKAHEPGQGLHESAVRSTLSRPKSAITALLIVLILITLSVPSSRNSLLQFAGFTAAPDEIHLVVLPFLNVGDDPANKHFNDGLVEILTSSLTMLQPENVSYFVVSPSDVRQRGVTSAQDAHREFSATHVLYGSTQRLTDQVRLTLNLVDARTARQISSEVLSVPAASLPLLQDRAVNTLVGMLNIEGEVSRSYASFAGLTSDPESYELYIEGRGYLQNYQDSENITRAIALFEEAIELNPDYALAYAGLAEAHWRKYDITRDVKWTNLARKYVSKAIEADRSSPQVLLTSAFIQNELQQYEDAMSILDQMEGELTGTYAVHVERARAHEGLGNVEEAEEHYLLAIEQKENYWGGYNHLALFYSRMGDLARSAEAFEKVTTLTPGNFRAFNSLGGIYFLIKEFGKATDAFEKSLELQANHRAITNLGTLYIFQREYAEAAKVYLEAIRLNDTDYRSWGYLGYAYYWMDSDSGKVRNTLQRAIELAEMEREITPNQPALLSQLAGYYLMIDRPDSTEALLNRITSYDITDPQVMGNIADLYEQLGNREEALFWLERALSSGFPFFIVENLESMQNLKRDPRTAKLRNTYD